MEPLSLKQVLTATGGALAAGRTGGKDGPAGDGADLDRELARRVSTDSRWIRPGDLFVCLEGPNFDGHAFAAGAVEDGAVAVLAHKDVSCDAPVIRVDDTLSALAALGRYVRDGALGAVVVGITGTNGKTSTKDLTAAALEAGLTTVSSERSYNNAIGVPLTLLGIDERTRAVVVELGTNARGEIEQLTAMARPEVGVITNIDRGHLEGLGSLEGVREEKVALLRGLTGRKISILNRDDPSFDWLAERAPGRVVSFGLDPRSDVIGTDVHCTVHGTSFMVDGRHRVALRTIGRHAVSNGLAALACAVAADVDLAEAADAMGRVLPPPGRLQVRSLGGLTVIDDTYNANPGSLAAAMGTVSELEWPGRMIVVLGDMLELGDEAPSLHAQAGREIAGAAPTLLLAVGGQAEHVVQGAGDAGLPDSVCHAADGWEEAVDRLAGVLRRGDTVLVKGSRGVVLDKLVARLVDLAPQVA